MDYYSLGVCYCGHHIQQTDVLHVFLPHVSVRNEHALVVINEI